MIFTKPLTDPEVVVHLQQEGKTLLEVTVTRYYLLDGHPDMSLDAIVHDWFMRYRGRSHAYRDGCHVGGSGDKVIAVKVVTDNNREIPLNP